MAVNKALFIPRSYLVPIKCVASALINADATHLPKRNPGQKQNRSRQITSKKAAFLRRGIKQGLFIWDSLAAFSVLLLQIL
jgi:hypothetical protein